jgi:hypothetical protein
MNILRFLRSPCIKLRLDFLGFRVAAQATP